MALPGIDPSKIDAYLKKNNTTKDKLIQTVIKKYGDNSPEYHRLMASFPSGGSTDPIKTVKPFEQPLPPAAPAVNPYGPTDPTNVHVATIEGTGGAYEANQQRQADRIREIAMKEGADSQAVIDERDRQKRERAGEREGELKDISGEFAGNVDQRRKDADKIFARQDQIAARNANIAAAQAGESGLLMSEGVMSDISNDIQAKYGQNIANAEQFKLETNKSLDQALRDTKLNIFDKQANIDSFIDSLDDERFKPILNALTAAAQGDKDAAKDVGDYYKKYIDMKTGEEYNRTMATERRAAAEKEFQAATPAQKIAILRDYLGDMKGFGDLFLSNVKNYEGMGFAQVLGNIEKMVRQDSRLDDILTTYQQGLAQNPNMKHNDILDNIINQRGGLVYSVGQQSSQTVGQTQGQFSEANKAFSVENPNKYTNKDNLAFYSSLTPAEKKQFDNIFRSLNASGLDRQTMFNRAREQVKPIQTNQTVNVPDNFKKGVDESIANKGIERTRQILTQALSNASPAKKAVVQASLDYLNSRI